MEGWLIRVKLPGMSPDGRAMVETWVASISDLEEAMRAVAEQSGGSESKMITFLDEEDLRGMGVTERGKVGHVSSAF